MSLLTPSYSSSMSSSSLADPSDPIVEPQPKFPHTRAQLAAIARQQRTNETDSDAEDDTARASSEKAEGVRVLASLDHCART